MVTMTLDLKEEELRQLTALAAERGVSVEQLLRDMSRSAIEQRQAYQRYMEQAARGDPKRALEILDELDRLDAKR